MKLLKQTKKIVKKKKSKVNFDDDANHVACTAYPCCDLSPLGCRLLNDEPEPIGWRY